MSIGGDTRVALVSAHSVGADRVEQDSLEEMTFAATAVALSDAELTAASVDSLVLHGQDQMNGRVISCMVAAGPAGGVDRDITMIASSAEHALVYGYLRLLAGQGDSVLVVAWGKPSEGVHPEHAELMYAEPYLLRRLGMNNAVAAALQASRLGHRPAPGDAPVAWPLTRADLPPQYDAVHAVVLKRQGSFDSGAEIAWIRGAGWATDVYDLGARDVADVASVAAVVRQLSDQGAPPPTEWDRAEIAAPSEPAVSALVGRLGLRDDCVVNDGVPTGRLATSPQTAGFARMVKAAEAAGRSPGTVTAGVGMQGFAGQGAAAMVFGKE
jgi:hypothetical protein